MLLSAEYVRLVLLAIVLATPMVWYAATAWIETFPYRTQISGIVFVVAGVSVLIIAVVTVSYQTIRAARVNPVESLRHE